MEPNRIICTVLDCVNNDEGFCGRDQIRIAMSRYGSAPTCKDYDED